MEIDKFRIEIGVMVKAGFDIGGTNLRYVLGDEYGNFLIEPEEVKISENPARQIIEILESLEEDKDIESVGIATSGVISGNKIERIDTDEHGRLNNIDLSRLGYETSIGNDANLGALGEQVIREETDVLYITFSTGIGAGFVNENGLIEGANQNAAKIGAYPLDSDFSEITEKNRGAWEELCAGKGIADFTEMISEGKVRFTPEELYTAASRNPEAREYADRIGELNAKGIATAVLSYDPEVVVLGGSIALENEDLFVETVQGHFPKYFPDDYSSPKIEMAGHGKNSELAGALVYTSKN
ncbi:MAG: ROK family protein [Candidatus Nanohaloarchaea archaeon]